MRATTTSHYDIQIKSLDYFVSNRAVKVKTSDNDRLESDWLRGWWNFGQLSEEAVPRGPVEPTPSHGGSLDLHARGWHTNRRPVL